MTDSDSVLLRDVRAHLENQLGDLYQMQQAGLQGGPDVVVEADRVRFHEQLDRLVDAGHVGISGLYLTNEEMPQIAYSDMERGERITGSAVLIAKVTMALEYLGSLEHPMGFSTQRKP